ncbi:MAG: hypothetical protein ACM3JG_16970 [Thiohalocapsa sp.]
MHIADARPEPLFASLCSWALISATPPRIIVESALLAEEVAALVRSSLGLEVTTLAEAAIPAAPCFRVRAKAGDVFHPLLPAVLRRLPDSVSAAAWEALLVDGLPGQNAAVRRLRPPSPSGAAIVAGGMDLSAYAVRSSAPAHATDGVGAAVVVPACLTARYVGPGFEPTAIAARLAPAAAQGPGPSIAIVIAGAAFTAIDDTLVSLARQVTAEAAPLILVVDDAQKGIIDGAAEPTLRAFPTVRMVTCAKTASAGMRWNIGVGAADADVVVLVAPGAAFGGDHAVETLARLAVIPGTGLVAAQTGGALNGTTAAQDPFGPWKPAAGWDPWCLPLTVGCERLTCWAISRQAWEAAGGFDESPTMSPICDLQFALRLTRMGFHNLRSAEVARDANPTPAAAPAAEWALRALYPEADAGGQRQPGIESAGRQLSFRDGRASLVPLAENLQRIDQSRSDFLARVLLEERRSGIERRAEFLEKLLAAAGVAEALESTVAELQRCLQSVDAACPTPAEPT